MYSSDSMHLCLLSSLIPLSSEVRIAVFLLEIQWLDVHLLACRVTITRMSQGLKMAIGQQQPLTLILTHCQVPVADDFNLWQSSMAVLP